MFELGRRKHDGEIAFSFHAGYQTEWKVFLISLSIYKYNLTLEWSPRV